MPFLHRTETDMSTIQLSDVQAVYDGAEGDLWELIAGVIGLKLHSP